MAVGSQSEQLDKLQKEADNRVRKIQDQQDGIFAKQAAKHRELAAQVKADSDSERALGRVDSKSEAARLTASGAEAAAEVAKNQLSAEGGGAAAALEGASQGAANVQQNLTENQKLTEERRIAHEKEGYERQFPAADAEQSALTTESGALGQKSAWEQFMYEQREKRAATDTGKEDPGEGETGAGAPGNTQAAGTGGTPPGASTTPQAQAGAAAAGSTPTATGGGRKFSNQSYKSFQEFLQKNRNSMEIAAKGDSAIKAQVEANLKDWIATENEGARKQGLPGIGNISFDDALAELRKPGSKFSGGA